MRRPTQPLAAVALALASNRAAHRAKGQGRGLDLTHLRTRETQINTATQEQAWNDLHMRETVSAPRFHVWTYAAPAIVLGCSQRSRRDDIQPRLTPGMELLVRPSGGGAVLTGPWMVSASVVLPLGHPWLKGRFADSYRDLGQLHVDVLAGLGVPSQALPSDDVDTANARIGPTVDWACYGSLAPWEVVGGCGRKLVGLAQRRQRTGVLLVAGTLVTEPDWALLCNAVGQLSDVPEMRRRTVFCAELTEQPPAPAAFAQRLELALARALAS